MAETEVIELSDSDELESSPQHVENSSEERRVRRSTRARKASVRFSPDDETTTSIRFVGVKSAPRSSVPTEGKRRRTSDSSASSSNCSSSYGMELVDSQVLITYVEKFKMKIRPGKFGINMPVGPDEFVLVDAVDYLRNLGYSDFEEVDEEGKEKEVKYEEEDDEELKIEFMNYSTLKEEVLFEPQAAIKMEDDGDDNSHSSEEKVQEVNFWDTVIPQPVSSAYINQDSSDVTSNKSTEDSIDVEKVDLTAFYLRQANAKKITGKVKSKKKGSSKRIGRNIDDMDVKEKHNEMERLRRVLLATQFQNLSAIVYPSELCVNRTAKITILTSAGELIAQLKQDQVRLSAQYLSLQTSNKKLLKIRENLLKILNGKKQVLKKQNANQQVKNYINSLL